MGIIVLNDTLNVNLAFSWGIVDSKNIDSTVLDFVFVHWVFPLELLKDIHHFSNQASMGNT
jgi:hypothetical protein